ncbi:hypothetical protein LFZ32_22750, partial [Salmonella enterica subsp. enterica serovar Newport str. L0167]
GKSNTLAKLYQSLINRIDNIELFSSKSKFVLIDFNGEYGTLENSFPELCQSIKLSTKKNSGKIHFGEKEFWDDELLSVLFSATEKTQKPFLTHLIKSKLKYDDDLGEYLKELLK